MLRVIRETRPLWVIGENVAGITNMVQPGSETDVETKSDKDEENYKETILEQEYIINTICDDLEREGYSVQPIIVPACGVGAPHKRYRVWFIASDCSNARVEGLRQGRGYWMLTNEYMVDKFDYAKELQPYKGMGLCSECGRLATSPDGRDVVVPGKWHGRFPKKKATEEELKRVGYKNLIR